MSELILFGAPFSAYVRAARMACVEKGIAHTPEGQALMARNANVKRALQAMQQRRSFRETEPPPMPG